MAATFSTSSKILFFSDVHLGAFSRAKNSSLEEQLIQLLDFAQTENYRIAVLGDLFDYWMEYPNFVPALGQKLLQRFEKFHQQNAHSLYITGNHDNWTLGYFAGLGFEVEPNYRLLNIGDRTMFLTHGDAVGDHPEQLQRPLLHRIIRDDRFLNVYRRLLPPRAGLKVMKTFSKFSRILAGKQTDAAKLTQWAKKMLENNTIDFILCGHDHVPRVLKYDYGTYINLGNFCHQHSLVEYNNGQFLLVKWNSNKRRIIPFKHQSFAHEQ